MKSSRWLSLILTVAYLSLPKIALADLTIYGEALCGDTINFYCHTVTNTIIVEQVQTTEGVKLQEKEVLETWELLWDNGLERDIVEKINRKNTKLNLGETIAVPYDMAGKTYMDYTPYPAKIEPTGEKLLIWDPGLLAYGAYDETGALVRWGPGVGGKNYCPDVGRQCRTRPGDFQISRIEGAKYRSSRYPANCEGTKCAPMPYALFFEDNYAFHAGNVPGYHASHGCVRVFYEDAKWLNQEFVQIGTRVIIRAYPTIKT